ncbi:MAG: type 1 glutamine amidotransferase [Dermatophilaceae bacterium]
MSTGLTFLVIEHEDTCPPAWLGEWWTERGVRLRRVPAHRHTSDAVVPDSLGDADALVVLGGEAGANDDADYPWLPATKALIARTVRDRRPFLGVCLGHQLATVALGGVVGRNPSGHSTGLTPVALTQAGRGDRLLGGFEGARTVQWNYDVALELPSAAVVLATAPDGTPQAVRFAPRAYGVQFHPEVSPAVFDGWTIEKPSAVAALGGGIDLAATSRAVRAAEGELRHTWKPLADRFVDLVEGSP